jgi:hypothetical protein
MLSAKWVREHANEFDVAHVHFGFDAIDPVDLTAFVDALNRHGKPLVYTVHDLRNPHHRSPAAHKAHLDVLISRADALITLTPGAADVVQRLWKRRPMVIPHPHVVEYDRMRRPRRRYGGQYVVACTRRASAPAWHRCRCLPLCCRWLTSCPVFSSNSMYIVTWLIPAVLGMTPT